MTTNRVLLSRILDRALFEAELRKHGVRACIAGGDGEDIVYGLTYPTLITAELFAKVAKGVTMVTSSEFERRVSAVLEVTHKDIASMENRDEHNPYRAFLAARKVGGPGVPLDPLEVLRYEQTSRQLSMAEDALRMATRLHDSEKRALDEDSENPTKRQRWSEAADTLRESTQSRDSLKRELQGMRKPLT